MGHQDASETARNHLCNAGVKPTLNRILILQTLVESETALTARDVYETVARQHSLNRITVYRTLDQLVEKEAINRVNCGDRVQHFCLGKKHSHFRCTECGEVHCIDNKRLSFDENMLNRSLPMSVKAVTLHLEGLCDKCGQTMQRD